MNVPQTEHLNFQYGVCPVIRLIRSQQKANVSAVISSLD